MRQVKGLVQLSLLGVVAISSVSMSGCSNSLKGAVWAGLPAYLVPCLPCDPSRATVGGGSGTSDNPYLICTQAQLKNIDTQCSSNSGWSGVNFVQCGSIDLQGSAGNPSSPICSTTGFKGSYEGAGFSIKNFYYNNSSTDNVGVFSSLSGGKISDLTVDSPTIHAHNQVGGLVGFIEQGSTITSANAVNADIHGAGDNIGGLVGLIDSRPSGDSNTVTLSSSSGTVTCTSGTIDGYPAGTGGLVGTVIANGTVSSYITYSHSSATVTGNSTKIGGLLGATDTDAFVQHSYATGAVSGNVIRMGGLIGFLDGGPNKSGVSDSYATGSVTSTTDYAGGLIGAADYGDIANTYATGTVSGVDAVGGLVGVHAYCPGCSVTASYATGSVSGTSRVGGLIGALDSSFGAPISNTYASGAVSGSSSIGGLIGEVTSVIPAATLSDSYSVGKVTGTGGSPTHLGGLMGLNTANITVTSCFWDQTTSGQSTGVAGTGETTSAMKTVSTFSGWPTAGSSDWTIVSGQYPKLKF